MLSKVLNLFDFYEDHKSSSIDFYRQIIWNLEVYGQVDLTITNFIVKNRAENEIMINSLYMRPELFNFLFNRIQIMHTLVS